MLIDGSPRCRYNTNVQFGYHKSIEFSELGFLPLSGLSR